MVYTVTCIRKRGSHLNPHERIAGLGGAGWFKDEDTIIRELRQNPPANQYPVTAGGRTVAVIVAVHNGRPYGLDPV